MAETKEKLIVAAQRLIHSASYGAVSVDDICKAAGVNKGSFYHFFKSKSDLAVACMQAHHQDMIKVFNTIFSPVVPAVDRFDRLVKTILDKQKDHHQQTGRVCGCSYSSLGAETAGTDAQITQTIQHILQDSQHYYKSAIRDLITDGLLPPQTDVDSLTQEVTTFIIGQLTDARIKNSLTDLDNNLRPGLFRLLGVALPTAHATRTLTQHEKVA